MGKRICPKCNTEVDAKTIYCPTCGAQAVELKVQGKKDFVPLYILLAVLIIACLILGINYYKKSIAPKNKIKNYLAEKYDVKKKDVEIVKLTKPRGWLYETVIYLDETCIYEIVHKAKIDGVEFNVFEVDPNNRTKIKEKYYDDYTFINMKDTTPIKEELEKIIRDNNMNGTVFNRIGLTKDHSRNDHKSIKSFILIEKENLARLDSLENDIVDALKKYTRYYDYEILILNSTEYYEAIKNTDITKYINIGEDDYTRLEITNLLKEELNLKALYSSRALPNEHEKFEKVAGEYVLYRNIRDTRCLHEDKGKDPLYDGWEIYAVYKE